jgi:transposase, IS5 family
MRKLIEPCLDIFSQYPDHESSVKMATIGVWLEQQQSLLARVAQDLGCARSGNSGASGLAAESVLRAAIYQAQFGLSFRGLEFALSDSQTARAFCLLRSDDVVSDTSLCTLIGRISVATWQHLQWLTVQSGINLGAENGKKVRIDTTVIDSNIHNPTDSSLLADCIRCASQVAKLLREKGAEIYCRYSRQAAKRCVVAILNARGAEERDAIYTKLVRKCKDVLYQKAQFQNVCEDLGIEVSGTFGSLEELFDKLAKVINQTERRVLKGESVPACEKIFSIFETHTDIIVKDRREVHYGHKVLLSTGASNMVLDVQVLEGNPSDAEILPNAMERVVAVTGRVPTQLAADGGFSSLDNVEFAKEFGVKDVAFSKHLGLEITEMCKSASVFQKLRNFRAGIEAHISNLKRRFGLFKCTWKSLSGFIRYVWSRVAVYNLNILARA